MYIRINDIEKSFIFIVILNYNINYEIKSICCNCNKKNKINNDINSTNLVIHKDDKNIKINENNQFKENYDFKKNNKFKENKENIKINDIINNNNKNNLIKNTKIDQNENKVNENKVNENKEILNDNFKNNDFRSDNFIINEKKIDKNKIKIKNINEINDIHEFKDYINNFFINSKLNIKDSDLEKFLKHYKSNEELLKPELYHVILEFFKHEVDNDKLLQLIEYKLNYNNEIILNYNKNVEFKDNTIFFTDNKNIERYYRKETIQNIDDQNLHEDIEIIWKDNKRTSEFTYDNINLDNSPINDNFIVSLTKVLVNLVLNNRYNERLYVQGMNVLARFFLFLTKEENNNKDIIFNPIKSYKLNYLFFNYKFNETFLKEIFNNETNFTILDCYNYYDNVKLATNIIREKIIKNLKISGKDIGIVEPNITCFITRFPCDITIGINNYNKLKNLFLLLFIFDRYNIIFDIFSLYLLKIIENEKIKNENDRKNFNFNTIEEILGV